ncbi:probable BOI-related E3 ubiquitin-protein ligase 3 [Aristolochia californica]|uniref:probable BOI-related E3 ubiquitin-protein ligase 3 n=1 Tax=Aristolochia californica TaxID=171875 RepID=UPI0035D7ECAE
MMAVEAHHLNLFPLQLVKNREILNDFENNASLYSTQMGFGIQVPPFYNCAYPSCDSVVTDSVPVVTTVEPPTRKRTREFSFLGEDLSSQIQQHQQEIDQFIAYHAEQVRCELSEKQRRHFRRLFDAVQPNILKRLKTKEDEIDKIGKINWVLEERVKSLSLENQIWRDLARTNEATAIALRTNLEQVLAQVRAPSAGEAPADVAESCCDSTEADSAEPPSLKCRNCHKAESCVLLLPCRHLCLCTDCGSAILTCPVCKSDKNASVRVNMS